MNGVNAIPQYLTFLLLKIEMSLIIHSLTCIWGFSFSFFFQIQIMHNFDKSSLLNHLL